MDQLGHQKSLLKETVEHQLMVSGPMSQGLELSSDMAGVTLKFLHHVSLKSNIGAQLGKEDELDVFIEFKINSCLLLQALKFSN